MNYLERHQLAWEKPNDVELPIVVMFAMLKKYAEKHSAMYVSSIGRDYVIGKAWAKMADGLLTLLNGETGRLDCGTVDRMIRELAAKHGVNLDN